MSVNVWLDEMVSDQAFATSKATSPQLVAKQIMKDIGEHFGPLAFGSDEDECDETDIIGYIGARWGVTDDGAAPAQPAASPHPAAAVPVPPQEAAPAPANGAAAVVVDTIPAAAMPAPSAET